MKIAYLGPEGSYSHLAAQAFLKAENAPQGIERHECVPFRNFPEVLDAVTLGRVDAAAIPIENSLQGGVSQNLDLLQDFSVRFSRCLAVRCLVQFQMRFIYRW